MKKILIIEDQSNIIELIRFNLEQAGYQVDYALDGEAGLEQINKNRYDLLILDLMLPKIDGLTLCTMLRKQPETHKMPIIMLTAKSTELDKIVGLEMGADDYVTKPFSVRELIARVKALLRRVDEVVEEEILQVGDIIINSREYTVTNAGKPVELTFKEFMLLKCLVENRGRVMTRDFLLDKIWGYEYYGESRTVDVHIRHLRSKLGEDLITTVRGIGYKIT
ncbi:MAG: response regulator transcription factor [Tissierellia bacterium]|jgi:two-component system alkaline phosphatase synthesis response regulator PhoP|nr:response regulator transcription factor [Tissierellia bacterium]